MKKFCLLILAIGALSLPESRAQSIGDAIQQLVLDYQKLTELRTILQDMQKDYQILSKGYGDIRNIAHGNFDLHKLFLDGLLAVSPAVSNYARVAEIISMESSLVAEYKASYTKLGASGLFRPQELGFIGNLYGVIFRQGEKDLDELAMVATPGTLRMADAERLGAIDRIYTDMQDNLKLLRSFNNSATVQQLQRAREANDIGTLKSIYGISN